MTQQQAQVKDLVVELLELSSIDSPFTPALVQDHRKRLVDSLLSSNKIDQHTADYLLQ